MNRSVLVLLLCVFFVSGCVVEPQNKPNTPVVSATPPPAPSPSPSPDSSPQMLAGPNAIPTDTRVVVNIPAYRMDIFQDGSLIKSYRVGIGTPEFPLPTGLRQAESVIFNPTWTVPDEEWAAEMKNVKVGETVEAGDKDNPLGWIKVPIGLPNLIHGGKAPAKIGTFASHGCVGLTNPQIKDFAMRLAQAADTKIGDEQVRDYLKDKTETREVKLEETVPVELRYETIVIEDGKLHVYKDVYEQNTNTEENLRAVLQAHGTSLENLTDTERNAALNALKTASKKKEVVVDVPSLTQKGYPAPVELDKGNAKQ